MVREVGPGPLWDKEPKTQGFRLIVPDPQELFEWAKGIAEKHAELTTDAIREINLEQLDRFRRGETQQWLTHEKSWKLDLSDSLFSDVAIVLSAGYSSEETEWVRLNLKLSNSPYVIEREEFYQLPQRSEQVVERLQEKGFAHTVSAADPREGSCVIVPDKDGNYALEFNLGYKNLDEAKQVAMGGNTQEAMELAAFGIDGDQKLPTDLLGFMKAIQHFQKTLPYFIDTCYEVMGFESPDVSLELSEEKALQ